MIYGRVFTISSFVIAARLKIQQSYCRNNQKIRMNPFSGFILKTKQDITSLPRFSLEKVLQLASRHGWQYAWNSFNTTPVSGIVRLSLLTRSWKITFRFPSAQHLLSLTGNSIPLIRSGRWRFVVAFCPDGDTEKPPVQFGGLSIGWNRSTGIYEPNELGGRRVYRCLSPNILQKFSKKRYQTG